VLALSAWCGLAAGWLEVGTRIFCRAINPIDRLYLMSRHFVWLTPLANLVVFVGLGLCLSAITTLWPRLGSWLSHRLLFALAIVPMLMVAAPHIFPEAWFILALGIASRLVPWLERRTGGSRFWLVRSFPALLGLVLVVAGSVFGGDWLKQRRERARVVPPPESPNVLFIVLDTVRADRLSLYGYQRPTTPALERLAQRGIRFDSARATAPWTLASHASFFTGHWPHELDVGWMTPLRAKFPMLAEYLGNRGYATAGFVANAPYCSYATGLGRGFTHYEDYTVENLSFLRTSVLFEEVLRTIVIVGLRHQAGLLNATQAFLRPIFGYAVRRDAESINRGFLHWLDRRREPGRAFFVFLNYVDAHAPYKVPGGAAHRFGRTPQTADELWVLYDSWSTLDKLELPQHYLRLAQDSYDNCLAYLDERLGELFADLQRRSVLDRTWVVITGDHGEGLGEHDLFEHGESLYSTEIRVPLLIVPPSASAPGRIVRETVSLRDLPATIVQVVGHGIGAPFPGRSLSPLWGDSSRNAQAVRGGLVMSELTSPSPTDSSHGRSPARRGPLVALAEGDFVYIRNVRDGTEELFDERDDPRELTNRARSNEARPILERFREHLAATVNASGSRSARWTPRSPFSP
jgi:arylsulfatase A-like enzyme